MENNQSEKEFLEAQNFSEYNIEDGFPFHSLPVLLAKHREYVKAHLIESGEVVSKGVLDDMETALTITKNSREYHKNRNSELTVSLCRLNKGLIQALEDIKEYQMDYVELAASTKTYQIADKAIHLYKKDSITLKVITDQEIESAGYADCGDIRNHRFKSSDQIEPWIEGAKWYRDQLTGGIKNV